MRRIDSIIKNLEQKIIKGTWPVGMRLPPEAKLCEQFAVSRTVVREALEQLRGRHLIITRKGSGSYVNAFSQKDLSDSLEAYVAMICDEESLYELMDLRILIESEVVAQLALAPDKEVVKALRQTIEGMKHEESVSELSKMDHEFHEILVRACGNRLYQALIKTLKQSYLMFSQKVYQTSPKFSKQVIKQHEEIVRAVEDSDPEGARLAMRLHISASREQLQRSKA